jgi:hypothetical protein
VVLTAPVLANVHAVVPVCVSAALAVVSVTAAVGPVLAVALASAAVMRRGPVANSAEWSWHALARPTIAGMASAHVSRAKDQGRARDMGTASRRERSK